MKGGVNRVVVEQPGEWISESGGWRCSCCGKKVVLDVFAYGNYCPVCGHKMNTKDIRARLHAVYDSLAKKNI